MAPYLSTTESCVSDTTPGLGELVNKQNKITAKRIVATTDEPHGAILSRAGEVGDLIDAVKDLIVPFIRDADEATPSRVRGTPCEPGKNVLVEALQPEELMRRMDVTMPDVQNDGRTGILDLIQLVLKYSVNTWDQGFLDKLCASTDAVGVASELVLAALNTNAHVYRVSPALTIIEKVTAKSLASLFGLVGPHAGGITCQGGSASNMTSLVTARGALYPDTKRVGNGNHRFVVFANEHGHYSIEKAAMACGFGLGSVVPVPADKQGRMDPVALARLVVEAKQSGRTPLYVSATAGTTVLGAYDPLRAVSAVCKEHGMWMHVDASWGGAAVFSAKHRHKLDGTELADSLTFNPHKMLHVPAACSFLLTRDTRVFQRANTLPADYLFHDKAATGEEAETWDMADFTLQCGRRADSLKMALSWTYYGTKGFEAAVDRSFATAAYFASLVDKHPDFKLASHLPLPSLQVCFYYTPGGQLGDDLENTRRTRLMISKLLHRGFMVDRAPGPSGSFFRIAFNLQTLQSTVEGLLVALAEVGKEVVSS
ncbi:putative glutamate decarboxylase [Microdochium trichocladiopsis]|uniref:Glutamate decarboxylase n=1 Tax=Microdochium trichocladiopsis TaxID=1682393 RepID=A0A9P9BLU5_9PEZI|nr:putative glutamate decarboxylase [Microdochium trichocladiopsis]KAH7025272.1 putative glutamate decarboxylase [Microdochium trichocladiopsis]